MKKCEEIKNFLEGKEIEIEKDEITDFDLGNYPAQSKEDNITLEDGYLYYNVNKDETKCYISVSKRTNPEDIKDEFLDDQYLNGNYSIETLNKLLDLI